MRAPRDDETLLLSPDEPAPATMVRAGGASPFFLACDHASNRIPRSLGALGLEPRHLERHIAWDVGAAAVAHELSARLDATLALQNYSRLVIDCNRAPDVAGSITAFSEDTPIPGNRDLDPAEARARVREVFDPYHDAIAAALDRRAAEGRASVLVAVHSFTPVYNGDARPWHLGVLYNRDGRFASELLDLLAGDGDLCIGDNEPYAIDDESDYTIPVHGERRGLVHVEFEIRQDLVATAQGQSEWAARLADLLARGLERLNATDRAD
ncbi:MAG: N-formylglutamate amidohydrolase [Alphaproteobacteria bacterium]